MALLEVENLSLAFSGLRALTNVSFNVDAGQIVGLIGPNGAGKSTLLNCISRLYRPDSGAIRFEGARSWKPQAARGRRARHSPHLPKSRTVPRGERARERHSWASPIATGRPWSASFLTCRYRARNAAPPPRKRIVFLQPADLLGRRHLRIGTSLMEYRRPSSLRARSPAIQSSFCSMNLPPG